MMFTGGSKVQNRARACWAQTRQAEADQYRAGTALTPA